MKNGSGRLDGKGKQKSDLWKIFIEQSSTRAPKDFWKKVVSVGIKNKPSFFNFRDNVVTQVSGEKIKGAQEDKPCKEFKLIYILGIYI